MKSAKFIALPLTIAMLSACAPKGGNTPVAEGVPSTDLDKQSYALGFNMGSSLAGAGVEFDRAQFNAGFGDAFAGSQRMTQEEIQAALMQLQTAVQAKQLAEQAAQAESNKIKAEAYLASNASAEGVVTTDSGLQYKVLVEGAGDKPSAEDVVTVHYEGRLIDGEIFDSSIARGEPATFPLNGVIPGWTEALQLMPVGSKWQLTIPLSWLMANALQGQKSHRIRRLSLTLN